MRTCLLCLGMLLVVFTSANIAAADRIDATGVRWQPRAEQVPDFGSLVPRVAQDPPSPRGNPIPVRLERISTAVPWPRGLVFVDGELVVLARGRHRRAGGVDHSIDDSTGTLFRVDTRISEPVVPGELASAAVRDNATVLVRPDPRQFRLPDRSLSPGDDYGMDRPYCTLAFDPGSRNLFVCGFSGVDLPGATFRKNATDSILRYDLRVERWFTVEKHDPTVVPQDTQGYVVSNEYYPHHDPLTNLPPHGWVNGPDGCTVVGDYLYAAAKDNHLLVQYDLANIRKRPYAAAPESRIALGPNVRLRHPGGERQVELLGPSAAAVRDGFLYVGYRTSSVVVRLAIDARGDLIRPAVAELIAVFEPWSAENRRSANLIDLAFDSTGALYASCARQGRIWKVGIPDPDQPFYGDDQSERATSAEPYLDLRQLTGKKTSCGNLAFDASDRLYLCSGNYDTDSRLLAGVIYRAVAD